MGRSPAMNFVVLRSFLREEVKGVEEGVRGDYMGGPCMGEGLGFGARGGSGRRRGFRAQVGLWLEVGGDTDE
jgi:hypothetical protein